MNFKADLHCHTTCSDGSMTPKELLYHAKKCGLSALSITDHDTIQAYQEALLVALELNIEMVSGVEFSSHYKNYSVHILGYAFSLDNKEIDAFCSKHHERRNKRNLVILDKLAKRGMSITEDELIINPEMPPHSVGRPHIAQALLRKGYVRTIREAFNKYIGEGCPCYAEGEYFSAEETIDYIHHSGGLAVIAHPHLIGDVSVIQALTSMNFDGIEVYYARFSESEVAGWLRLAHSKNWLATGGSDFHGSVKPNIALGSSWAPEETFRVLQAHYRRHKNNTLGALE
ncbi:MAG: PHP domain-containing protein [Chlamydiales bacterium]|nr:PHP domain-containing protein [Chlamydiales bacterium]